MGSPQSDTKPSTTPIYIYITIYIYILLFHLVYLALNTSIKNGLHQQHPLQPRPPHRRHRQDLGRHALGGASLTVQDHEEGAGDGGIQDESNKRGGGIRDGILCKYQAEIQREVAMGQLRHILMQTPLPPASRGDISFKYQYSFS